MKKSSIGNVIFLIFALFAVFAVSDTILVSAPVFDSLIASGNMGIAKYNVSHFRFWATVDESWYENPQIREKVEKADYILEELAMPCNEKAEQLRYAIKGDGNIFRIIKRMVSDDSFWSNIRALRELTKRVTLFTDVATEYMNEAEALKAETK